MLVLDKNLFTGVFFADIRISELRRCESRSKDEDIVEEDGIM